MPKRSRARGMNAALDSGEAGVGEMKPAHSPMRPRQLAVASVVALTGSGLGLATYHRMATKPPTFSGIVTPAHTYYLNFPATGTVLTLNVKPGDHVHAGQVLATMDGGVAAANLAAAQAAVTADTATVAGDEAPQPGATQQAQNTLSVTQASAAVTAAKNALLLAQNNDQHTISSQTVVVTGAQNAYSADGADYTQQCSSTATTSTTQAQFCQNLKSKVGRDATDLSTAQAELARLQASAKLEEARDLDDVTQRQAILTAAEQKVSAAAQPLTAAVIAQDKARLATAQAQVATDEQAVRNATLTAPADGVVADTRGAVGDLAGPEGVHAYGGPAAQPGTQADQQPGFQLFVPNSNGGTGTGPTSAYQPLLTLYAGPLNVTAQVPEQNMAAVHSGAHAKLNVTATGTSAVGTIGEVTLDPARVPGTTTYYDVLITLDSPPQLLAGMTVDVSLF
ncbi:MAG: biotin/lipoyl-binding protein [Catenulispora sp.]|nr:biotin/lipoyl-binding protein [Catenulispora sp.]